MPNALRSLFDQDLIFFQERIDVYAHILDMNHLAFKEYAPKAFEGPITQVIWEPLLTKELLEDYYPVVINNSIYISVFSFFEYRVKHLAARTEFIKKTELKHTDLIGGNFDGVLKFLKAYAGFNPSLLNDLKPELEFYKFIRNKLVHQGGLINLGGKTINLDKNPHVNRMHSTIGIHVNSIGQIEIIQKEFVHELMKFCLMYYEKINKNAA